MGSTIQEYLASLRGKRVAVLGIGAWARTIWTGWTTM